MTKWIITIEVTESDKPTARMEKVKTPDEIRYEKRGARIYRTYVKNRIKQIQGIIDAEESLHDADLESEVLMLKRLLKKLTTEGGE
jgi:hypothetical protein